MKKSEKSVWPISGLVLAAAAALIAGVAQPAVAQEPAQPRSAEPAPQETVTPGTTRVNRVPLVNLSSDKWGIIGRNTYGSPNAVFRDGPWGRTSATFPATQSPPYGDGSLGLIVDTGEKIAFGNETNFAGQRLSSIDILRYWVFAGTDNISSVVLPNITIEADPNVGTSNYTSLVYQPDQSTSPSAPATPTANVWQRYDATAAGNRWWATGSTGTTIGCTQATPCTFQELKARMPNAVISYSLGISKGRDTAFVGAVDGLQVNRVVYDFEFSGVRTRIAPR
ncbi:hypothetical protein Nocox_22850 [Nonomuraea coxensis DSM 45129]|uniref:Uncharacterized protein n=1 Tax=Nonomuraea coxensis DSM 45129 TaxID=1122611 RepID=A0ABX8U4X2_9ACTN|nr:hypothetical protein Nocox_22850 [Nonomuraea coxensis DSM 45129]